MASTITLAGGNNVTLSTAANAATISAANQTAQTQGILNVGVSTGGNTSGNTGVASGTRLAFVGTNNVTLSQGTAAGATTITISGPATSAQQTGISGIQASNATYTSGTVIISGGNNITVSSGANQSINIHGPNTHAQQTAISGLMNTETTYTSGTVELEGTNNITVFSTTGQRFRISGANTHAQQTGISSIAGSNTTYTAGLVEFTGSNIVTVRSSANSRIVIDASVAAQSAQTQGILAVGASTGGNTIGDTGVASGTRLVFSGNNNITISEVTAANATTLGFSGPNVGGAQTGISALYDGANSISSGTVRLTNANNFSFTINGNTLSGSVHAPETPLSVGVSTGGNTAGNTTVNTGSRLVFSGQSNITLSQATAAGATTIGISGPNAGAGGNFSAGASTGGNTAGDTGITGTRLVLVGTNAVSLSQATDANGGTVSINVTNTTHAHTNFSGGISNLGNTAGSTGVTGTRLVLVGSEEISLSGSTDANGGTVSILAGPNLPFFFNLAGPGHTNVWMTTGALTGMLGTPLVKPLMPNAAPFPGRMTANTMYLKMSNSGSTATMSAANTVSVDVAIYTLNGSTLSLLNSVQTTWGGAAATNNSTSTAGIRYLSIHSSKWSAQPVFSQAPYWIYINYRTAGVLNQTMGIFGAFYGANNHSHSGTMGVATANATSMGLMPFLGVYSASTASPPTSIGSAEVNKQHAAAAADIAPAVLFAQSGPQSF